MKNIVKFLLIFSLFYEILSLSTNNQCDEKYNGNSAICSSNFIISTSTSSYKINESVYVTIRSTKSDETFIGIHLLAQNEKNLNVGTWKITNDTFLEETSCGSLKHNSNIKKTNVYAVWTPTTNINEDITIKAIIIEDENTIYIDCYKIILTPQILNNNDKNSEPSANDTTTTTTTTTTTITATTTTTTITATTTTTITATTTTTSFGNTTVTPSPTADVSVNVTWIFYDDSNTTSVHMTINNLKVLEWAAFGLGLNQSMGEAHVFMCKRLPNNTIAINRYINPNDHHHPEPAGSEQGGILTPDQQQFNEGVVICQFNLSNFPPQISKKSNGILPLSQSTKYHPIFAIGLLDSDYVPQKHARDSRLPLPDFVRLNQNETILYKIKVPDTGDDLTFVRVHGIMMVYTWILIVSTGILISRYFKNLWPDYFICGKLVWFATHRFLMSIAAISTTLAFLFILIFDEGTWVERGFTRPFVHSIAGSLVIGLTFFQPLVALFRCEPNSRYRFIYNYIHRFLGFSALILSILTLFLATYFKIFKNATARILMIIWIVWIVFIFIAFEVIQQYFRRKYGGSDYSNINASNTTISEAVESPTSSHMTTTTFTDPEQSAVEQKFKTIFLALHILVAIIISIIFTVLIV